MEASFHSFFSPSLSLSRCLAASISFIHWRLACHQRSPCAIISTTCFLLWKTKPYQLGITALWADVIQGASPTPETTVTLPTINSTLTSTECCSSSILATGATLQLTTLLLIFTHANPSIWCIAHHYGNHSTDNCHSICRLSSQYQSYATIRKPPGLTSSLRQVTHVSQPTRSSLTTPHPLFLKTLPLILILFLILTLHLFNSV